MDAQGPRCGRPDIAYPGMDTAPTSPARVAASCSSITREEGVQGETVTEGSIITHTRQKDSFIGYRAPAG